MFKEYLVKLGVTRVKNTYFLFKLRVTIVKSAQSKSGWSKKIFNY